MMMITEDGGQGGQGMHTYRFQEGWESGRPSWKKGPRSTQDKASY